MMNLSSLAWHQIILEEKAMPEPTEKHKTVDPIKHELENASMSRPAWALHRQSPDSDRHGCLE
jgi:hypothetical protein